MKVTLNLLSPSKKAALQSGFLYAYAQTMLFIVFLVIAFATGTLFAVRLLLTSTYDDLASRAVAGEDESKTITDEVRKINEYLKRIDSLDGRFTPWSKVLEELTLLAPPGTQFETIRVDEKGKILLTGTARVRDDVLLLRDRLERSALFTEVKSPLSNILQQRNVKFDFEMKYVRPQPQ